MNPPVALAVVILVLGTTAFVVFVERAQRRISVNYAKRQVGRRMYAGQQSHLPFKLNMSGVIPPIFASSCCCSRPRWRASSGRTPRVRSRG